MRKWDAYKNMNRNSTMVNHFYPNESRADAAASNIVMGQIWLQEDTSQMEIIELDSDDSELEPNEELEQNLDFADIWNYLDKDRYPPPQPDFYPANVKAREKRRIHNSNSGERNLSKTFENNRISAPNNMLLTNFYDFTNDLAVKNNTKNHQSNCFTIINKPFNTPDSSSDEKGSKDRLNTPDDSNGTSGEGEIVSYDEDIDSKHTIWIYSFQNKRRLSENDFELVNIPSQDSGSSTSCSFDNFIEERTDTKNACRVSSPIPSTYVPRLNLSLGPTLPTVTEITEPNGNRGSPSDENTARQKCVNNWFAADVSSTSLKKDNNRHDKSSSTDVMNWMCLSPRERRRRFKHTNAGSTYQPNLPVLSELPSSELTTYLEKDPYKLVTTAEINAVEDTLENEQSQISKTALLKCKANNEELSAVDARNDNENESDIEKEEHTLLNKPKIDVTIDRIDKKKITEPIEKLHSNNWIHKEEIDPNKFEDEPEIMDIKNDPSPLKNISSEEGCASRKLWVRNMSLLKPVEWTEFLPITQSVPSLHLSIESDSRKLTWLSQLAKCFRCFK